MSLDPVADLGVFLNPEEFATEVRLWPGMGQERVIYARYGEEPHDLRLSGALVGSPQISLLCRASDLAGVAKGTPVSIPANPRLGVPGGNYAALAQRPVGLGMTLLILQVRP